MIDHGCMNIHPFRLVQDQPAARAAPAETQNGAFGAFPALQTAQDTMADSVYLS
jgi:hypothetical protein